MSRRPKTHASGSIQSSPQASSTIPKSILSPHFSPRSHRDIHDQQSDSGSSTHSRDSPRADQESAPLLVDPRNSSYSYSLPRSLDVGQYSDSADDSPQLYGESFIDHSHFQRQFQDQPTQLHAPSPQRSQRAHRDSPPYDFLSGNNQGGSSPPDHPSSGAPLTSAFRPSSHSSPTSRHSRSSKSHAAPSTRSSSRQSGLASPDGPFATQGTLIMPEITTSIFDKGPSNYPKQDRGRGRETCDHLSTSATMVETLGPMPRMMTPSPVPLHARLSKIQKDARKGARVLDMENNGASHHYDYGEATDSSYDFSSRRHSVAEEDVCYPLQSTNLDIDFEALEDYILQEQVKTQKAMQATTDSARGPWGVQTRVKSSSSGIMSKLRSATLSSSFTGTSPVASGSKDSHYGSIRGKTSVPDRTYSLFGERDKSQIPLDDAYRFTLYSTASVTVHAQTLGEIPPRGETLSKMLQAGYFWLDVLAPTDDEIRMLSQVFRIHPLTTEDILMEEGREKCEMFVNYYFVCFRTFVLDPNSHHYMQPLSIYTLVFPGGVISYHFRPVPHCRNVRKRIRHLKERMEVTPDWINYAIIDDIVDAFAPLIRQVETEVDMIDELVLILKESEQSDMLRRIGNCRKRVMSLLRLLTGKADVIKGLIKRYEGRMGRKGMGEIGLFMGDIQDHIITMLQNLSHYEKILSRSHSNYLAQINIEMTSASNETNDVLTKLTVLGSILLPMNLVTGLWGMNVPVPGQESEDLAWFFWIVTAIFLAASLFLLIARKIKLL